jgi:ankyrin repeat protein
MCHKGDCTILVAAAVQSQCTAATELLVRHDASVNAADHQEITARHCGAVWLNSSSNVVNLLIRSEADVDQVVSAYNGKCAAHTTALEQRSAATAQLQLDAGAHQDSLCLREALGS